MSHNGCDRVRELLPDYATGRLSPDLVDRVQEHLSWCQECGRELGVVRIVVASPSPVPSDLESRITSRIRSELAEGSDVGGTPVVPLHGARRRRLPVWGLSAAALVVLSLGIGVVWSRQPADEEDPLQVALQGPLPEAWLWDDGLIAGGLDVDGLTDEELEALLEELEK